MANTEDYLDNLLDSITQAKEKPDSASMPREEARARRRERRSRVRPQDDFMEANGLNSYRNSRRESERMSRRSRGFAEDDFLRSFESELSGENEEDLIRSFEDELEEQTGGLLSKKKQKPAPVADEDDFDFGLANLINRDKKGDSSPADSILANIAGIVSEAKRVASEGEDETSAALDDALREDAASAGGGDPLLSGDEPDLSLGAEGAPPLSDEVSDDVDLMDILSGEGDDDLSDIGELLASDENQEELEEARESFDEAAEDVAAGGSGGGGGGAEGEAAAEEEEKKPNIIQKILGSITGIFKKKEGDGEESEDEDEDEDEDDEEGDEAEEGGETKEEKKARLKKEKEEAKKKKKEEADAKKKAKDEEKKKKAEEKKKKAAEKKARPKKKKKPKERSPKVPIPVLIVFVLFSLSIVGGARVMTGALGGLLQMSTAQNAFDDGDYLLAYQTLAGKSNLDKNGNKLRNKAKLMAYLQTKLDQYEICMNSGQQMDSGLDRYSIRTNNQLALDSLIQGVYFYKKNAEKAENLQIADKYDVYGRQLEGELSGTFKMTVGEAVDLYHNTTRKEYTAALQKVIRDAGLKETY